MKTIMYYLIMVFLLIALIFSCIRESENSDELNLTIKLFGNPQCNSLKAANLDAVIPNSKSCIEYSYNKSLKILSVKHINAGFNCCPESLTCTVTYKNDSIIIQEFEKNMGCKCNCLYNLEMEVEGVEPGKYQLRMIEPYLGNQDKLDFDLDLLKQKEGSHCVDRNIYPWGE